jgi:hypothetical protein
VGSRRTATTTTTSPAVTNTKFGDSIYFFNGNTLYVNLFVQSTLSWPGRGLTIRQDTTYPESPASRLTVTAGSGAIDLRIRIPSWAGGAQVRVNGTVTGTATPGSYLAINRTWATGDVVDISLPMALTLEPTPDNPSVRAVKHGPIVLAGQFGTSNLSALPTLSSTPQPTGTPLEYTAGSVLLRPFYKTHGQRYSVYWNVTSTTPREARYLFDEASGTSAADATGNGWTATLAGGVTRTAGRSGNAVLLNGSSGYVSLPAGILSGVTAFTIATWVRIDAAATWTRVFDFGTGSGAYLFLTPRSSSGTARYAITSGGSGAEQRINAPAALPTGAWTHVAVTHTGTLGVLYVNGAEVARNTALTVRPSSLPSTTQNWIGRSQYGSDPYLTAAVDSFRIHSRALTAAEVAQLFSTGQ